MKDVGTKKYEIAGIDKFSVHTLEFRIKLKPWEMDKVLELLVNEANRYIKNPKNTKWHRSYILYFEYLPGIKSINVCKFVNKSTGYKGYYLSLVVNTRKVLGIETNLHISIAPYKLLGEIMPKIKAMLSSIGIEKELLQEIYLHRVDYCVNIDLRTEEAVMLYINLLRKGRRVYNLKETLHYDLKQKRTVPSKYNYVLKNSQYEFCVYSKYHQMKSNQIGDEREQNMAIGQLRIEYRVCRDKIRAEKYKYKFRDDNEFLCKAAQTAHDEMSKLLLLMYGAGDFVKKEELVKRIKNSSFHQSTKDEMMEFVWITNKQGMQEAYKQFKYGYQIMDRFNRLGISPIYIKGKGEIVMMHSPLHYIAYNNVNER